MSAHGKKVQGIAAMMLRHTQRMNSVCCPMINLQECAHDAALLLGNGNARYVLLLSVTTFRSDCITF